MNEKMQSVIIPLTVNTYDIDAAGHVNNIVYVRWLEDLRIKLANTLGDFKKLFDEGYYLVVISTEIKYRRQIKLFDKPYGTMEYAGHKHGIITLKAIVTLDGKICVSAFQKCVVMNLNTDKMVKDETLAELLFIK
ncbi:MAG: thioesterase family protein [bacterium]